MKKLLTTFLIIALALLGGCASSPKQVEHSFSFDGWHDGWAEKSQLLAYDYGGQYQMVRNSTTSEKAKLYGNTDYLPPRTGIQGGMPPGEYLYVKWRIKATNEIREVKVDLKPLLPKDIRDHELTFVIDDRELFVYLVTRKPPNKNDPIKLKTWHAKFSLTYEIYPTNTYPKQ